MISKEEKQRAEALGRAFTEGFVGVLAKWFIIGLLVLLAFNAARDLMRLGYDGTDDKRGGDRSGMALRTDYGTGCQYLETSNGALAPRLGRDGKQICR